MPTHNVIQIREKRTNTIRATIIEKAIELIKQCGLSGLSARGLAKLIGFTNPMLYIYFGKLKDIKREACRVLKIEYKDNPEELIDILIK